MKLVIVQSLPCLRGFSYKDTAVLFLKNLKTRRHFSFSTFNAISILASFSLSEPEHPQAQNKEDTRTAAWFH